MTKSIMCTTNSDYVIDIHEVVKLNKLSERNGSIIYKALWRGELVCIKEVSTTKNIHNELNVLSKCIHPKIVQFLGAHIGYSVTSMLFEYMENGNLENYIKSNRTLSDYKKMVIIKDIVLGLHYLHSRKPHKVIHRDVKPANILVNKYGDVKVCDFGLSKLCQTGMFSHLNPYASQENRNHSGEKGTYLWMAPEVCGHKRYDHMSDIYSMGLTIHYIWTGRIPYEDTKMSIVQLMYAKTMNTLQVDTVSNPFIDDLIRDMTQFEPMKRIRSCQILQKLNQKLSDPTVHVN
jgi:serine/threonine protein kinase